MTYRAESRMAYEAITSSIGELAERVLEYVRSAGRHGCTCDGCDECREPIECTLLGAPAPEIDSD